MKRANKVIAFHNLYKNCTDRRIKDLKLATGQDIPEHKVSAWRVYAPKPVVRGCLFIAGLLPKVLYTMAYYTIGFVGNLLAWYLGGFKAEENVGPPQFTTWKDLFDPERLLITSPLYVKERVLEDTSWLKNKGLTYRTHLSGTPLA